MNSLRLVLSGWLLALLAGLQAGVGLLAYTNARQVVLEKTATAEEKDKFLTAKKAILRRY